MDPAWDDAAILHELFAASRRVGALPPDAEVIERPGLSLLRTPSFRGGGFNEVVHTDLAADEADAVIDETIAAYHRLGIRFRWRVDPGSRPSDLGERLAARGLRRSPTRGMVVACDRAPSIDPPPDPSLRTTRVDLTSVDAFTEVSARGWAMDPAPLLDIHRRIVGDPESRSVLFLTTCGGVPAGAAGAELRERSIFLMGAVVLPEFRGQGVYRALLGARLRAGLERGLTLAVTHALETTSAPILGRLGFTTAARFAYYLADPPSLHEHPASLVI